MNTVTMAKPTPRTFTPHVFANNLTTLAYAAQDAFAWALSPDALDEYVQERDCAIASDLASRKSKLANTFAEAVAAAAKSNEPVSKAETVVNTDIVNTPLDTTHSLLSAVSQVRMIRIVEAIDATMSDAGLISGEPVFPDDLTDYEKAVASLLWQELASILQPEAESVQELAAVESNTDNLSASPTTTTQDAADVGLVSAKLDIPKIDQIIAELDNKRANNELKPTKDVTNPVKAAAEAAAATAALKDPIPTVKAPGKK